MRLRLTSIIVAEQNQAERFDRGVLGLIKKQDFPVGEFRWLSVVAPDGPEEFELSLEPNAHPGAQASQQAMRESGIPLAAFEPDDLAADFARLSSKGVVFTLEPTDAGQVSIAMFEDTCGNLIQIYQHKRD
ncbi:MAG: VOC family protein [Chloroflexota bacterium]